MNVNDIKRAIDKLEEDKNDLEEQVKILKEKLSLASRIIRTNTFSATTYKKEKEVSKIDKCVLYKENIEEILNILEK
jgi:cell division septum initiation protein DivIVA